MRFPLQHGTYANLRRAVRAAGGRMSSLNVLKRAGVVRKIDGARGWYIFDTSRPITPRQRRRRL